MPLAHIQVEQDILRHFARSEAKAGSAFDVTGFWCLTIPKYLLTDEDFSGAMRSLAGKGYVDADGTRYELTPSGATHLNAVSAD